MMAVAAEEMRDGNEDHSAQRGSRKRIQKSAANVGTNQAKHDVTDAAETTAAGNFSGEPSGNQAEQKPRDETVRLKPDSKGLLRERICREHEASFRNKDCI